MHGTCKYAGIDIGEVPVKQALEGTGFDSSQPAIWILEGLVMCALLASYCLAMPRIAQLLHSQQYKCYYSTKC
jgi:hypothetical protein